MVTGNNREKSIEINEEKLEKVTAYEYVGRAVINERKIYLQITHRTKKTKNIHCVVNKIKKIEKTIELKVYSVMTRATQSCASETWTTKHHEKYIITAEILFQQYPRSNRTRADLKKEVKLVWTYCKKFEEVPTYEYIGKLVIYEKEIYLQITHRNKKQKMYTK